MDKQQELIDAAQALIDRWYTTDWKAEATATFIARLRDAVDALSEPATPELPQDVESWLEHNHRFERDAAITKYVKVFDFDRVAYYLQQREAAHAAELAQAQSTIDSVYASYNDCAAQLHDALEREAQAKEQGRREAYAQVPLDAASHAAFVILHCGCGECDKYREPLDRMIDSARASQEVGL